MTDEAYEKVVSIIDDALAAPDPAPLGDGFENFASHAGSEGHSSSAKGGGDGPYAAFCGRARWKRKLDWTCCHLPLTDMGNAQRFVARYGRNFVFVDKWGWLAWDGKRWSIRDADALLQRAVQSTIKAIAAESRLVETLGHMCDRAPNMEQREKDGPWVSVEPPDDDTPVVDARGPVNFNPLIETHRTKGPVWRSDKIAGWGVSSQAIGHVACIAKLAQPYLTANPDEFDADPYAFNVANGTLRFKVTDDGSDYVSLHRHAREDRLTKITSVAYDPAATCPIYDAFLDRVQPAQDDEGNPRLVQRHLHALAGIGLTGLQLQYFWFWYGLGGNGKSVLLDIWGHVTGEYSQAIPIESFLDQGRARRGGEASPDIAALPGVRLLRTSEPTRGAKIDEGLVKLVTGGEIMRARHLNEGFFEFRPTFKLVMLGNHRPRVDGTDEGFWRRVLLVPWLVIIPEAERDPYLVDKLKGEQSGILNRMLDGVRDYLDHGLQPPDAVRAATADYRDDSDPIGQFLAECTKPNADATLPGGEFYKLYVAWAKANGERPFTPKAFSRSMLEHGIRKIKSSGVYYCGIETTTTAEAFKGMEFEHDGKN
jgi:putative DNA primase/helicase